MDAKDPSQPSLLNLLFHTMRSSISTLSLIDLAAALAFLSAEGLTSRRTGTRYSYCVCFTIIIKAENLSGDSALYRSRPYLCRLVLP